MYHVLSAYCVPTMTLNTLCDYHIKYSPNAHDGDGWPHFKQETNTKLREKQVQLLNY